MTRQTLASIVAEVPHCPPLNADCSLFPVSRKSNSQSAAVPTIAELEHAAYLRGLAAGLEAAQQQIAAAAAARDEGLQELLAQERQRRLDGEGQQLASRLLDVMTSLEKSLADQITPVLRHLVDANLVDRAMTELRQILLRAVAPDGAHKIAISGSPGLIASVKSYLPANWSHADFIESSAPGIHVVAGNTDMHVDLEAWRHSIAGGTL